MNIDLGCGPKPREGYLGVDIFEGNNPQICADITRPIPGLANNCADRINCSHVLEHILGNGVHAIFTEIARLLKPGGIFEIRVPHPASDIAMVQGHIHVFTPRWWHEAKRDDWFKGKVVIDTIEEILDPQFVQEYEALGRPPTIMNRYLRNVYIETFVVGHKP
jgi:predicted SAM-dependent methyltransferase